MTTEFFHIPVLCNDTINALIPNEALIEYIKNNNNNIYTVLDCTLGGAGHACAFFKLFLESPVCEEISLQYIGVDQDTMALSHATAKITQYLNQAASARIEFKPCHVNFGDIDSSLLFTLLNSTTINALLADLGVSSPQIDTPERGFSLKADGPLDMRMNTSTEITASSILQTYSEKELTRIFFDYGEEPKSRLLAKAIMLDRKNNTLPTSSTKTFAEYITRVLKYKNSRVHPATRAFQALRIEVNNELESLKKLLHTIPQIMSPFAKAAIISFHSLEDRIVKHQMRAWEKAAHKIDPNAPIFLHLEPKSWGKEIPRGGITASEQELTENFRAHSARLRIFCFNSENRQ